MRCREAELVADLAVQEQSNLIRKTVMAADPFTTSQPRAPVVSTTEAREGVTGHNVRYVLIFSLVGAVAALVILYLVFFSQRL
jgi:hypothetical protein